MAGAVRTQPPMTDPAFQDGASAPPADSRAEAATLYGFAGTIAFFTLLSRILGMARDLVIAHRFGATGATDAWVQAFRIPNALRRLTGEGAMTIAFVPIYVQVRAEDGAEAARAFARRVLGLVLVVTIVLSASGIVLSEPLTAVFSPGFLNDPAKFALTARLLAWTFPYLAMVSLVAWAMGVLNAEGRFAAPAAAPILLNVGIIVAVLAFSGWFPVPILSVAAGVLAGGVAQVVLQVPSLLAVRVAPLPLPDWRDPHLKRLFALLLPSLFGLAVYELNLIVLGVIASYLPTGQIFHYSNATRLSELVLGLFTFAFATAGLPTLSEHRAREDWPRLRETLRLILSATSYTILPAMVGLAVASQAIVAMLFLHGEFAYADVSSTAATLRLLTLGLPAVALVRMLVPVYYAFGDARTPVFVSALTMIVTGALAWLLSQRFEVQGLAAGLSLGTWFQCGLLALLVRSKTRPLGQWIPWRSLMLQLVTALVMGAAIHVLHGFGVWSQGSFSLLNWVIFVGIVAGGATLYFLVTLLLGEPQARHWLELLNRLTHRSNRRSPTGEV